MSTTPHVALPPAGAAQQHGPATTVLVFHAYQNNRAPGTSAWPLGDTWAHQLLLATDLAVELFFVLSGFLLWNSAARSGLTGWSPRGPGLHLLRRRLSRCTSRWS